MPNLNEYDQPINQASSPERNESGRDETKQNVESISQSGAEKQPGSQSAVPASSEAAMESGRPMERTKGSRRPGARGTAAMDPQTRKEVARKGGLAVSRNRQ